MKRLMIVFGFIFTALAGVLLFTQPAAAQSTNDFEISSYTIDYTLSRDAENHSVLKVSEFIVAEFPNHNQNHGIERAIPKEYDGHPLRLSDLTVTDGHSVLTTTTYDDDNGNMVVRIGDADKYVHGQQGYLLTYMLTDVTRYYQDTDKDEWYWDTNGTEWRVPINSLKVTVTVDEALSKTIQAEPICYYGAYKQTGVCELERSGENTYTVMQDNLVAGANITVAFGFPPQTFSQFEYSIFEQLARIWQVIVYITVPISLVLIVIYFVQYQRRRNRTNELRPIPVQYIPPKGVNPLLIGEWMSSGTSAFAAQLIDWAVRHYIAIYETKQKSLFGQAEYDIEIKQDPSTLMEEERELLSDLFGGTLPQVGARVSLKDLRNDTSYTMRLVDNPLKIKKSIEGNYGLREQKPAKEKTRFITYWAISFAILAILTLSPFLIVAAIIIFVSRFTFKPLTDTGLSLWRYLEGYKTYIKAAEADRLAFLQGPDTAEKVGRAFDVNDKSQLVKLYERSLPYAILFGQEKQWSSRLSEYYKETASEPTWFHGATAFHYASFTAAMSSFSTASSSYGGGITSSSGGSGGGGFSGGGGGGGGGGGW